MPAWGFAAACLGAWNAPMYPPVLTQPLAPREAGFSVPLHWPRGARLAVLSDLRRNPEWPLVVSCMTAREASARHRGGHTLVASCRRDWSRWTFEARHRRTHRPRRRSRLHRSHGRRIDRRLRLYRSHHRRSRLRRGRIPLHRSPRLHEMARNTQGLARSKPAADRGCIGHRCGTCGRTWQPAWTSGQGQETLATSASSRQRPRQ